MYNEVPEDLMAKIKEAEGTINKHNCAVDTMLIAVGNNYYGYQPHPQPKKNIDLLVCFVALKDGGATVFVAQEAVNRRPDVFNELKRMEEHHAKIS